MQTGSSGELGTSDTRGKHRISAELKRLEQENRLLETFSRILQECSDCHFKLKDKQEELELLEKTENVSAICKELLINIRTIPDPLLPLTNGPINPIWDRWFEGAQNSSGCRCPIL